MEDALDVVVLVDTVPVDTVLVEVLLSSDVCVTDESSVLPCIVAQPARKLNSNNGNIATLSIFFNINNMPFI